jgi:hypothetical protein
VTFNLAAGGLDLGSRFEGQLLVEANFGTIAATAGLRIDIFPGYGSTPTYSTTNPNYTYTIPAIAGLRRSPKIHIPTGRWQVLLTNLDTTNGLTVVQATMDTVDSVT